MIFRRSILAALDTEELDMKYARSTHGFTQLEMVVALVVVAILTAVAVPVFIKSRERAERTNIIAVAQTYNGAINQFQMDHNSRAPQIAPDADWAIAEGGPIAIGMSRAGNNLPYLRGRTPDLVSNGTVKILMAFNPDLAPPIKGQVVYQRNSADAGKYTLSVHMFKNGQWVTVCQLGNVGVANECV